MLRFSPIIQWIAQRLSGRDFFLKTALLIIILLGVGARVFNFGQIPISLNQDEASIAYNAWGIAKHGVDEWNQSYPLMFKAFGDYKLPGYIYTTALLMYWLEPTPAVVRLPALVAGLLNIGLIYLIASKLLTSKFFHYQSRWWAPTLLAVSPWAIFYSRVGFEAQLGLSLFLAAFWLALRGLDKPISWWLVPILLFFSGMTYNSPFLLTIPFLLLFSLSFWPKLKNLKRQWALVVGVSLVGVFIIFGIQNYAFQHKSNTLVFFDPTHQHEQREARFLAQNISQRLLTHPISYFTQVTLSNYLKTIGPHFLVKGQDGHPWHSIPGYGYLSWSYYILLVVGLLKLVLIIKNSRGKSGTNDLRVALFLLALILISPLPSALTIDAPHATRALVFLGLTSLVAGLGAAWLMSLAKNKVLTKNLSTKKWELGSSLVGLGIAAVLTIELLNYTKIYHKDFIDRHPPSLNPGLMESIGSAIESAQPGQTIVVVGNEWSPYIYVLLAKQMKPEEFQQQVVYHPPDVIGYKSVKQLGRFWFVGTLDEAQNLDKAFEMDQLTDQTKADRSPIVIKRDESATFHWLRL